MSLINISNLTFAYDGSYDNVFENVSFMIDTDWKLGFTGRNGRGKTTFLNLLLGKYEYAGDISASVNFEYFPYEISNTGINTIDVINGVYSDYLDWELARELNMLEVSQDALYRPFETLSMGERTKIMLAVLFLKENSFLLIDEPTNHLDMAARIIVGDYLNSKKGFILVSHDRALLDNCADHILSINKANIELQRGNFSVWFINKERQDNFELSENDKLQKNIKKLKQAAKQSGEWADKVEFTKIGKRDAGVEWGKDSRAYIGEKSRRMQQRRKNLEHRRQSAIDEKSKLLKNIERTDSLKLTQLPYHSETIASLRGVSIFYDGKAVCQNISFAVSCGDRIALRGRNGSGKSSVMKLILGEGMQYSGEFSKGSGLKLSYVPQDASHLSGTLSGYAQRLGIDESRFKTILRKLDFSREQFDKDMKDLSSGQKKKALIAGSLCEQAHLLLWDEPLNFIDVYSRIQIEDLLLAYKPTIIFVEHDSVFCNKIATKNIDL